MTDLDKYKLGWYLNYLVEINLSRYLSLNEELKRESILTGNIASHIYNRSNYVMPVIENYLEFNYLYNDIIEFVKSLNYEEYLSTINKLDLKNYNISTVKGNKNN